MPLETRTARLTVLIDPRKKALFERLCAEEDVNPSQVVRRLIRAYIEQRLGRPWKPADDAAGPAARPGAAPAARRAGPAALRGRGSQRVATRGR